MPGSQLAVETIYHSHSIPRRLQLSVSISFLATPHLCAGNFFRLHAAATESVRTRSFLYCSMNENGRQTLSGWFLLGLAERLRDSKATIRSVQPEGRRSLYVSMKSRPNMFANSFSNSASMPAQVSKLSLYHNCDSTTIPYDALVYEESHRNYDMRSIRLRYDYDTTTTKNWHVHFFARVE